LRENPRGEVGPEGDVSSQEHSAVGERSKPVETKVPSLVNMDDTLGVGREKEPEVLSDCSKEGYFVVSISLEGVPGPHPSPVGPCTPCEEAGTLASEMGLEVES
jgi:hypothetical protein